MLKSTDSVFYSGNESFCSGESIISSSEINDYVLNRSRVSPRLHINEFSLYYGSQSYTFNSFLQNQDCLEKKILHYFYKLRKLIYTNVEESNVFQEIDLFYDETLSEHVLLAHKFGNDFSTDCQVCYVQKILESLCQDRVICELFQLFLRRKFKSISRKSFDRGFICYL